MVRRPGLQHVGGALASGWGTLLKPLAWHGDLCFGPSRGTRVTFMRPGRASARWSGVPEPDEAAPSVIASYLRAYGPATLDNIASWLSRGRIAARTMRRWVHGMGDRVVEIGVGDQPALVLAEDLDELASARPGHAVRLPPGFDQWVLGPGTNDAHVVPPGRRTAVSRQSGWIAPVVVASGVVAGTWEVEGEQAVVSWFREAGVPPRTALEAEADRLAPIVGGPVGLTIRIG